jgi:hypothetical protein
MSVWQQVTIVECWARRSTSVNGCRAACTCYFVVSYFVMACMDFPVFPSEVFVPNCFLISE